MRIVQNAQEYFLFKLNLETAIILKLELKEVARVIDPQMLSRVHC